MKQLLPFLLTAVLLVTGCKPKQVTTTGDGDGIKTLSEAELVARGMADNRFQADWVDARANIKLESPQMNVGGNAYIRLEKDKRIWLSVKKFGFEAARALITPDSFYVINRLQNEYVAEPLSYIEEKYKMPAEFDFLQNIILGNPIILSRNLEIENVDEQYHLSAADNRWTSDYWAGLSTYYLERMRLREVAKNRSFQVFMDDFRATTGSDRPFAFGRELEIESPDTGLARVKLDFKNVSLEGPFDMPFNKR